MTLLNSVLGGFIYSSKNGIDTPLLFWLQKRIVSGQYPECILYWLTRVDTQTKNEYFEINLKLSFMKFFKITNSSR